MSTFVLQNESLRLEYDLDTGALVGLAAVETSWRILDRPELGLSWRLVAPLPGQRNNGVFGEAQRLASLNRDAAGRSATFVWDGVTSEHGGRLDIRLTLVVTLADRQAIYALTIENRSPFTVENVYCPYLGDVRQPANAEWLKTFTYSYATAIESELRPTFRNTRGYFGVDYPTFWLSGHSAATAPFILLRSADQGLYAGVAADDGELVTWHAELRPGFGSSMGTRTGGAPVADGAATRFAAVHLPYVQPGETRRLTPVALEAYRGDWSHGADVYRRWRGDSSPLPRIPAWASEPHAWQQIHINSPEDELRVPFRELVKVGEECARHGVKAIQLVGWNDGGQDQGNPSHDPDPRLGTFAELRQTIRDIQALGVKVVLFAKFTWADRATEWFRQDLHRLAIKDPYGDYYIHPGYQYQTATQCLDVNTKRLIPMCFSSEEYLRLCEREFLKTVELGADGILFDECLHHGPALLCFDTSHGHRVGQFVYANDRQLIRNFAKLTADANPDFLYAGEACYDAELEVYHLSYHRSESRDHVPLIRFLRPDALLMTAVTGFADRDMVNQCLLYRYVVSYEPYNFKGRLDDYPATLEYGKKMDALRAELREYFWDGEYRHDWGARVTADGKPHEPYAVYRSRESGRLGLVVVNYDAEPVTARIELTSGGALTRYRTVDRDEWRSTGGGIVVPANSAVVVI